MKPLIEKDNFLIKSLLYSVIIHSLIFLLPFIFSLIVPDLFSQVIKMLDKKEEKIEPEEQKIEITFEEPPTSNPPLLIAKEQLPKQSVLYITPLDIQTENGFQKSQKNEDLADSKPPEPPSPNPEQQKIEEEKQLPEKNEAEKEDNENNNSETETDKSNSEPETSDNDDIDVAPRSKDDSETNSKISTTSVKIAQNQTTTSTYSQIFNKSTSTVTSISNETTSSRNTSTQTTSTTTTRPSTMTSTSPQSTSTNTISNNSTFSNLNEQPANTYLVKKEFSTTKSTLPLSTASSVNEPIKTTQTNIASLPVTTNNTEASEETTPKSKAARIGPTRNFIELLYPVVKDISEKKINAQFAVKYQINLFDNKTVTISNSTYEKVTTHIQHAIEAIVKEKMFEDVKKQYFKECDKIDFTCDVKDDFVQNKVEIYTKNKEMAKSLSTMLNFALTFMSSKSELLPSVIVKNLKTRSENERIILDIKIPLSETLRVISIYNDTIQKRREEEAKKQKNSSNPVIPVTSTN